MIHAIAAIDRRGGIGKDGDMLFHIREDLRRFKLLTMGHTLIMGRKTFDSLPGGALPGRRNIVITRNSSWSASGAERATSLQEAIVLAGTDSDIFIIGGGEIYRAALEKCDILDITAIDSETADADTYFPQIPLEEFAIEAVRHTTSIPRATFYTLRRKNVKKY